MSARNVRRVATVVAGVVVPLLVTAAPALAKLDDGEVHEKPIGLGEILLLYVVIPIGASLVIAGLAALPSLLRRPRYRPGRPWSFDPMWFAGPEEPEKALTGARPGATARGGASAEW